MLLFRILSGLIALGPSLVTTAAARQVPGAQHFSRDRSQAVLFNQTCPVGSYVFDPKSTTLGLSCNTDDVADYASDWTLIELDQCVANNDGALVSSLR